MTLKGKIFMCTTFLFLGVGIGLVGGYRFAKANSNEGNQVVNNYNGKNKIKDSIGSGVTYDLETRQEMAKEKDEASWWEFWK